MRFFHFILFFLTDVGNPRLLKVNSGSGVTQTGSYDGSYITHQLERRRRSATDTSVDGRAKSKAWNAKVSDAFYSGKSVRNEDPLVEIIDLSTNPLAGHQLGLQASFLSLGDTMSQSEDIWPIVKNRVGGEGHGDGGIIKSPSFFNIEKSSRVKTAPVGTKPHNARMIMKRITNKVDEGNKDERGRDNNAIVIPVAGPGSRVSIPASPKRVERVLDNGGDEESGQGSIDMPPHDEEDTGGEGLGKPWRDLPSRRLKNVLQNAQVPLQPDYERIRKKDHKGGKEIAKNGTSTHFENQQKNYKKMRPATVPEISDPDPRKPEEIAKTPPKYIPSPTLLRLAPQGRPVTRPHNIEPPQSRKQTISSTTEDDKKAELPEEAPPSSITDSTLGKAASITDSTLKNHADPLVSGRDDAEDEGPQKEEHPQEVQLESQSKPPSQLRLQQLQGQGEEHKDTLYDVTVVQSEDEEKLEGPHLLLPQEQESWGKMEQEEQEILPSELKYKVGKKEYVYELKPSLKVGPEATNETERAKRGNKVEVVDAQQGWGEVESDLRDGKRMEGIKGGGRMEGIKALQTSQNEAGFLQKHNEDKQLPAASGFMQFLYNGINIVKGWISCIVPMVATMMKNSLIRYAMFLLLLITFLASVLWMTFRSFRKKPTLMQLWVMFVGYMHPSFIGQDEQPMYDAYDDNGIFFPHSWITSNNTEERR